MSGDLLDLLAAKPQRETAGSDAASRFDYQKNWAFYRMLDLHISGNDYLVAFEFHDDVLFLDNAISPQAAEFFQVKTQKKAAIRKLAPFLKPGKKPNSILGKLCSNFEGICKPFKVDVILVSNHPYEFSDVNVKASSLSKKNKAAIIAQIKIEHPTLSPDFLDNMHFYVTDMPIDTAETHLQGRALDLFKQRFGEAGSYNVFSWIRSIQGEIRRRNNFPSGEIKTVPELVGKKCLSKDFIDKSLDDVESRHKNVPDLNDIKQHLTANGWPVKDILKLNKTFPQALVDYQDPTNDECQNLIAQIERQIMEVDLDTIGLSDVLEIVQSQLPPESISFPYNDGMYIKSLILMVYYEKI